MAEENSTDLLMMVVQRITGRAVPGEATSDIDPSDATGMLQGFSPAQDGKAGTFSTLRSFGLGLNLNDTETTGNTLSQTGAKGGIQSASAAAGTGAAAGQKFARWRSAPDGSPIIRNPDYVSDMDPVEYERIMDAGSPILFQNCCNTVSFKSITIVKRKVTGRSSGLQAFLKMTFTDVLLISLDWANEDAVIEKGKFIYKSLQIQYRRQLNDGSLESARPADWQQMADTGT